MDLNSFIALISRTWLRPMPNASACWQNLEQPVVALCVELGDGTVIKFKSEEPQ